MTTYRWPNTSRQLPEDIAEHATRLKAEFDLVNNTANVRSSHATPLPSSLESKISIGIEKGIAEASSKGFCPKWSEIDKSIFTKVMLKNISAEAAIQARDRITLSRFRGLYESYKVLHTKLTTQMPPTAIIHRFISPGAAIEAISVVDLVKAAERTNKGTDLAGNSEQGVTVWREEKPKDGHGEKSEKDSKEEERSEVEAIQHAGNGQGVKQDKDSESPNNSSDGSIDDGSFLRCTRCQAYGHLFEQCSAPHRCGKCAGRHSEAICKSKRVKCASCGGGHRAGVHSCPAMAEARKSLGFLNANASQAAGPVDETQATPSPRIQHSISAARTYIETSMPSPVSLCANSAEDEIKSGSDQSLPEAGRAEDAFPDTATLLKHIEDLRKIIAARDTALQSKSSGRTKRRAGEAFGDGAEHESSIMTTKRIK